MKEVLEDLGVPRSTMDDWRARGQAPLFTKFPSGMLRIRRAEYDMWLAGLAKVS